MKRALAVLVALSCIGPAGSSASASHPEGSCLVATPDETRASYGSSAQVRAKLYPAVEAAACGEEFHAADATSPVAIDVEITGVHDPDDSDSPTTPDAGCTIDVGEDRCDVTFSGPEVGTDFARFWIDEDGNDATVEADLEETRREEGSQPEPDITSVAEIQWSETTWHGDPPQDPSQCSDGQDNDGDGTIDYPDDSGCSTQGDDTEANPEPKDDVTVAITLTIRHDKTTGEFRGSNSARIRACQREREVVLHKESGDRQWAVASDVTNTDGNWRIRGFEEARGRYYATIAPKRFTRPDGSFVRCRRNRSVTIKVR